MAYTGPQAYAGSLAGIRKQAGVYPVHLLADCQSALVLFCAGFLGAQDAIHIHDAHIPRVVAVDRDTDMLVRMQLEYPQSWRFVIADVYEYAAQLEDRFDILSVDPPIHDSQHSLDLLGEWCRLARKAVVVGVSGDVKIRPSPKGWKPGLPMERTAGAYWLTYTKADA